MKSQITEVLKDLGFQNDHGYHILISLLYIGNFSRGFDFRGVCDLPELAKNRHSKK